MVKRREQISDPMQKRQDMIRPGSQEDTYCGIASRFQTVQPDQGSLPGCIIIIIIVIIMIIVTAYLLEDCGFNAGCVNGFDPLSISLQCSQCIPLRPGILSGEAPGRRATSGGGDADRA